MTYAAVVEAVRNADKKLTALRRVLRKKGKETMSIAHPGFKAVQSKIATKEGVSKDRAGAILASATRHASPAAKKANPKLKKVKG